MKKLSIVYHTQSRSTEKLANYIYEGCLKENSVETNLLLAAEADSSTLLSSNGVIFGTPENFGYMSGALKDFFDRTFYEVEEKNINIPYCTFVSAGNDGTGAVREIDRILKGYPMKKIAEPIIVIGQIKEADLQACRDLGQSMACALSQGII